MSDDGIWRDPIAQAALDKSHGKIINSAMDYGNSSMPSYHGNTSTSSVQGNYQSTPSYSNYASSNQFANSYGYYGTGSYGGYDTGHGSEVIGWGIVLFAIGTIFDELSFLQQLSVLLVGGYFGLKLLIWAFKTIFSLKGIVAIVIALVIYLVVTNKSSYNQPSLLTASTQGQQQVGDKLLLGTPTENQSNGVSDRIKGFFKTNKAILNQPKTNSASRSPKFTEYSSDNIYTGNRAGIILPSDNDKLYRTRLLAASNADINFAGEYVFQTWDCKSSRCETGAVISARTGNVYHLPFEVCCWEGEAKKNFRTLDFRSNSRLIVAAGLIDENGTHGAHFYEFTGTDFKHIKTIPVAKE